jgi:hypothetical protein
MEEEVEDETICEGNDKKGDSFPKLFKNKTFTKDE